MRLAEIGSTETTALTPAQGAALEKAANIYIRSVGRVIGEAYAGQSDRHRRQAVLASGVSQAIMAAMRASDLEIMLTMPFSPENAEKLLSYVVDTVGGVANGAAQGLNLHAFEDMKAEARRIFTETFDATTAAMALMDDESGGNG